MVYYDFEQTVIVLIIFGLRCGDRLDIVNSDDLR